ncbi:MAG: acireductone synthase [Acidobacteria bacterium]|nr:MAG: acireductone synthase [Acidobacteriota bacterium]REJ99103.1 MAG: acireductone synthase [Acidobacteriota bacterium]REK16176.1 MAG: acireductone synthase [Acidobacteriota bacterium]REK43857.1 MAG: acireductone synthase [Acidobacteriota bacterium]
MAFLLDIEGTTTPIDFVHKVLFPYARNRMAGYVEEHFEEIGPEILALESEAAKDNSGGVYREEFRMNSPGSVSDYLKFLIDNDRKSTPLKSIQGMIWKKGYESGDLVSQVYADVPAAFRAWREEGDSINIYSSGSALAQVLLFRHTDHGDLTGFIDNYFDTNIGHKKERNSYAEIASRLDVDPSGIVFVSDVDAELDAATAAGMRTYLSIREGNPDQENAGGHQTVRSLEEIV